MVRLTVRHHYIEYIEPVQATPHRKDTPIASYLNPTEMIILAGLGRLRLGCYVGTVGELYSYLTGRKHPKVWGEAS